MRIARRAEEHRAPALTADEERTPAATQPVTHASGEAEDWAAAVAAVDRFFHPRSVAVIGASRGRGSIGGAVLHNLLSFGFAGPVLPVNPKASVVQSVLAYARVEDVPGPVDLAVVVVPAGAVLEVAEGCGRKGVRALVVISAGFAESGPEGVQRQNRLIEICRIHDMRLIGPNCMGIFNAHPDVRLNATFAPVPPPHGRIAFMSQSGALGLTIMEHASRLGIGLSSFVSVGNKADISGNDLIRYWADDPDTDVILLYLESFGNPRKFSRIAREVVRRKPIVAVKSGRSLAGARATGSHTGALVAASDITVDALFRQAGVIRTDTLREMFGVASLLATQPPPAGRRVAILTNAGGPAILCADLCAVQGLEVADLSEETQRKLRAILAPGAGIGNPVDMIATGSAEQYREAIGIVASDPAVDALIVIFVPPVVTRPADVARGIVTAAAALDRELPVLPVFMQAAGAPPELSTGQVRLPCYDFPEDAVMALAAVARYAEWRARPVETPAVPARSSADAAAAILRSSVPGADGWMGSAEVRDLLACFGLDVLEQRVCPTAHEAERAAHELGGRVALKALGEGLLHKSEMGAVRVDLRPDQVRDEAVAMEERLARAGVRGDGFLVQAMAAPGLEMIVGVVHDPQFGPVVACGAGGVLVELLRDVSVRLAPLTRREAEEMVRELATAPLLTGYRGSPPLDVQALVDTILRVSALVEAVPEIAELDLNPIIVHERGASIVDARVRATGAPTPVSSPTTGSVRLT